MKRISTRFALLMAAAAVLPLLAYGAVSIVSLRTGARQAVVLGNQNVARQVTEQIDLYVTGSVRILKALAADLQQTGLERWQQDRIVKNFVLEFAEFQELTLIDDAGTPIVSSRLGVPTVTVPGSESVNVEGALMSRFSLDDDLLPTSIVAVRLAEGGWLVGRLNLEAMWRMVDRIRVGEQGYALVVTGEGQLLAHGNPDAKSRVARGDTFGEHPLITQLSSAPDRAQIASAEYEDERGPVLGVAARLPTLGWTVVVEQPVTEAFAIPIRMQTQLGIAISVALLAMLVAGYVWGHQFIDPILALTRGTRALAEGRLDERVRVDSTDEIGELGNAFNNMADRLVELQEDVRKKERQAMFGRIAISLVHDLSHPIQNIGNSCKLIVKMFDDVEYRESFKRTVERELAQVKRVLDDLRNVARPLPLERFPLDINKAILELLESMQTTAESAGLTIEAEPVFGPLYIEGDLFALNRVYRNLLMNAMQATPPHGRVVIRTLRQNEQAIIEVADTGCGIPAERLETIFDDFVTTKRRGLGLGLAISKKVVEQLGGTISVASEVGLGSTFTLRFPLTKARPSTKLAAV
ncbi:MAG: sensor histidine kinase [Acidimicrobiia bacterium]|nr:sensor histidine kinase [Acidimicrobiia bacterium]